MQYSRKGKKQLQQQHQLLLQQQKQHHPLQLQGLLRPETIDSAAAALATAVLPDDEAEGNCCF